MSASAEMPLISRKLRVLILARDSIRKGACEREPSLGRLLADLGHVVVGSDAGAEITLVDGDVTAKDETSAVTLGGPVPHQAGALARNAGPAQIDVAPRAAAVGLTMHDPALTFSGVAGLTR